MFVFYDWQLPHVYFAKNIAYFPFNSRLRFQRLCRLLRGCSVGLRDLSVSCATVSGLYASGDAKLMSVGGQATLACGKNNSNEATSWWRRDRQLQNDTFKYIIHARHVNTTLTIRSTGNPQYYAGH